GAKKRRSGIRGTWCLGVVERLSAFRDVLRRHLRPLPEVPERAVQVRGERPVAGHADPPEREGPTEARHSRDPGDDVLAATEASDGAQAAREPADPGPSPGLSRGDQLL